MDYEVFTSCHAWTTVSWHYLFHLETLRLHQPLVQAREWQTRAEPLMMQCSPNTKGVEEEEEVRRWERYSLPELVMRRALLCQWPGSHGRRRGEEIVPVDGPLQQDGDWWTWFDTQPILVLRWSKQFKNDYELWLVGGLEHEFYFPI